MRHWLSWRIRWRHQNVKFRECKENMSELKHNSLDSYIHCFCTFQKSDFTAPTKSAKLQSGADVTIVKKTVVFSKIKFWNTVEGTDSHSNYVTPILAISDPPHKSIGETQNSSFLLFCSLVFSLSFSALPSGSFFSSLFCLMGARSAPSPPACHVCHTRSRPPWCVT